MLPIGFFNKLKALNKNVILKHRKPAIRVNNGVNHVILSVFHLGNSRTHRALLTANTTTKLTTTFGTPLTNVLFVVRRVHPRFHCALVSVGTMFVNIVVSAVVCQVFGRRITLVSINGLSSTPLGAL